jgi:hypothetical protein
VFGFLSACCTPSPETVTIRVPRSLQVLGIAPPRLAPPRAHWVPFDAAPDSSSVRVRLKKGDRELIIDSGYTRWMWENSEWQRSEDVQGVALSAVAWLDSGFLAATKNGSLLVTDEPLAPFRVLIDKAPTRLLSTYEHTLTIEQDGRVGIIARLPSSFASPEIRWLNDFQGRPVLDARLNAQGKGLILFSPQLLAETSDFGQTLHPIPDADVLAKELRVVGSRIVVVPGGEHDVFARSYVVGSGKLERSLRVPEEKQLYAKVGEAPNWLATEIDSSDARRSNRFSMAAVSANSQRYTVDGDTVVYAGSRRLLEFTLGKPVSNTHQEMAPSFEARVSACGGTFALGYDRNVYIRRGEATWRDLNLPDPESKTWAGPHRIQGITLVTPRHLVFRVGTKAYLLDLEHPQALRSFVAFEFRGTELESGCSETLPAKVWDSNHLHHRMGYFTVDVNQQEASRVTQLQKLVDWTDRWIANFDDGSQLYWTKNELVLIDSEGVSEKRALPGDAQVLSRSTPNSTNSSEFLKGLGLNREGRGIYIEPENGEVWQTIDKARTFTKVQGVGRSLGGKRVFCTRNRCEVDNEVVRVGWDDPALPALPQNERKADHHWRLTCSDSKPLDLPKGLEATQIGEPVMKLGSRDWIAGVTQAKERSATQLEMSSMGPYTDNQLGFAVQRSGTIEYYPLHKWYGPVAASGVRVYASEQWVGLISISDGHSDISGQSPVETWLIPQHPHQPPRKIPLHPGEFGYPSPGFSLSPEGVITPNGVGFIDFHARRLFLLDRRGNVTQRSWAGAVDFPYSRPSLAQRSLAQGKEGTLLVANRNAELLELYVIDNDGYIHSSRRAVASSREIGVGIISTGFETFIVMPVDRDNTRQLFRFPLGDSMQLGVGEPLGEAALNAQGLLDFPPCNETIKEAAFFELTANDLSAVVNGQLMVGALRRVLRVQTTSESPLSVCVANTSFTVQDTSDPTDTPTTVLKILWTATGADALVFSRELGLRQGNCAFTQANE